MYSAKEERCEIIVKEPYLVAMVSYMTTEQLALSATEKSEGLNQTNIFLDRSCSIRTPSTTHRHTHFRSIRIKCSEHSCWPCSLLLHHATSMLLAVQVSLQIIEWLLMLFSATIYNLKTVSGHRPSNLFHCNMPVFLATVNSC